VKRINVYGSIIPNSYKWYYDYFEEDATCPKDVISVLNEANGDEVEVYINSPGGIIDCGSEIYTALRSYNGNLKIFIVGQACSAASIIAMAGYSEMSPTALMMVHCVSSGVSGNHSDMEKMAEVLRTADDALSNAYVEKTGMSKDEVLAMMESETWLTAEQAKEKGLINGIMFEDNIPLRLTASNIELPSEEKMDQIKELINKQTSESDESAFLIQKTNAQFKLLQLKGER
jgi:ATP-dependent Clp endopeptidase proteolytic subunit ClpP